MTKRVGGTSESYTSGSLYTIPASTGEGSANTSKASFILKLEVDDPNNSASATYNYHVNLRDENAPAVVIDDNNGSDNMGSITIEDENGDGKIEAGEEVTVTADPNTGSDFIGWQDENGIVVSEDEEFTFTAGEDFSNLTALFNKTITSSFKDEATTSPLTYTIYNEAEVAEVDGCDAGAVDVTIPETITREGKTYIVYKIKDATSSSNGAFYQTRSTIESVTISDKITKIGYYAFRSCSKLTDINWGENVRELGSFAFAGCISLTSLVFPNSLKEIKSYVFGFCSGLTSLVFPDSLRSFGDDAFRGCSNITSIILNEGLEELGRNSGIGTGAFGETKITTLHIPASVKSLEENIVAGCSTIQTITVDANNLYYEDRGLNVIIGKSDSPNTSERNMLKSATNSTKSIPEGVTSIGEDAFAGSDSLTSITIPSSVTSIESCAFYGCDNLTEVTIENKNIYKEADGTSYYDAGCLIANAQTIRILKTIDDGSNTFLNGYDKSEGSGEYADYNFYTPPVEVTQDGIKYRLHNSTLTADVAGYESTLSGDVVIPSSISYDSKTYSVTFIDEDAFDSCDIISITIPDSVTSIGDGAFHSCDKLVSVLFTGAPKITEIPRIAFTSCPALESINIPSSVTRIGSQAFKYCSSLTTITIPSSVTEIEFSAFEGCSSLTSITIPSRVIKIEVQTFRNCSSLTTITIPSSVKSISSAAFGGCNSLTEINVDENNENYSDIDGVLFNKEQTEILQYPAGKTATTYDIPAGVTIIGSYAFDGCSNLATITIPSGVTSLGSYTFRNCSSLTSITIPSSVTTIEVDAFEGCTNLKTVYCDSVVGYTKADSNSSGSSHLFDNADTVYVLASIRDGGATNYYLNDTTRFYIPDTTTNVNGQDYYVYTRK